MFEYGTQVLQGLECQQLVCLDDLQLCAGDDEWELAVFSLINHCRTSGCKLLISCNNAPAEVGFELPDLLSRLGWGAVVQLQDLDEADKFYWLQQCALCLLYTSPSPRDATLSRMPSSA